MKQQWQQYENILKTAVKPALGCTEPIAVAFAAAVAAEMLSGIPDNICIYVSDNLYKNSMGVFVPGTGKIGLPIAAAVGALGGNPNAGLEVLAKINDEDVQHAQTLIDAGLVKVHRKTVKEFIYCCVEVKSGNDIAIVEIRGGHTRIVKKMLNNNIIFSQDLSQTISTSSICNGIDINIGHIYNYATSADFNDLKFILDASILNSKLSQEGLDNTYGLAVGRTMNNNIKRGIIAEDLMNQIVMRTTAASDARMGGAMLPAMSNFGSGNQGIAATIPLVVIGEHFKASDELLTRALIMSHLGAIYIKSHYPPLSAFCGNTVTSAATAMAMVYLAGGTFEQSCYAIQNVLSDCSGMICDGAKSTCAMKVRTSTSAAVNSFLMAMQCIDAHSQGIIAENVEITIRNIGKLVTAGMSITDTIIIDIMSN
ncbi:serine dehydratase subunit alpha family protein [Photobacterium carnosum]|uniref:L-cysteine desulfidase family protein n=1 Tax=Photobacterium carnosum TaxID=2023717 RepID=UPI001E5FBE06|nr:L-serine ammonia-lyase, iron-sulfur-dependent, subunit alpha [Photobacterium carnosum]MCD9527274.1 serine dehydratase subunit alpha family protein [Photobacterium carnosum]